MPPNNPDPTHNPQPSSPAPSGPPRQDFSRPVQSFSRRPMQPRPGRIDDFRPRPQQPQPQFQPQPPATPQPVFSPPQPAAPKPAAQDIAQPRFRTGNTPQQMASSAYPSAAPQPSATPQTPASPFPRPQPASQPLPDPDDAVLESVRKDDLLGMTGSRIQPKKAAMPKGVFVIATITLIGFVASFFDSSQLSLVYTIIILLDLLLVIGLFLRMEVARKFAFWLAVTTVILNALLAGVFYMSVDRANSMEQKFIAEAKRLQSINVQMTREQQEYLDNMQKDVESANDALGKSQPFVYGKLGATIVAYCGVALYLSRPKVKESFRTEPKQPAP